MRELRTEIVINAQRPVGSAVLEQHGPEDAEGL
jgi:hypothetical protein